MEHTVTGVRAAGDWLGRQVFPLVLGLVIR